MHVETTQMDPRIARIHWRDYRDRVKTGQEERRKKLEAEGKAAGRELGRVRIEKTRLEKEDDDMKRVYWQLSQGQTVLNLPKVIGQAGFTYDRLPKLACCRADYKWCGLDTSGSQLKFYKRGEWSHNRANTIYIPRVHFDDNGATFTDLTDYNWRNEHGHPQLHMCRALVPTVPANLRPRRHVSKYHILWEANWENTAPEDPILLSRVTDNIFIVVAQWDLTPVEKMVLEGRL